MKKVLSFVLSVALGSCVLASCGDKTIPAEPSTKQFTLPSVTEAAPETTAPATSAGNTENNDVPKQEPKFFSSAEEFVADYGNSFNSFREEMLKALAELEKTDDYDPINHAITKKSYEMLSYSFGEIAYTNTSAATVEMTLTMLDEKAVFEKYIEALKAEDAPNDMDIINGILSSDDVPTTVETTKLSMVKYIQGWSIGDAGTGFNGILN